jgi:hypothetical protein
MKITTKNKGLRNPAVTAVATSEAGEKAIAKAERTQQAAADVAVKVLPWLIKIVVVGTIGYVAYRLYTDRFKKASYNNNWPDANVTDAQAQAKADAIYNAMYGYGANAQVVAEQLIGLNYNGWIKVYNAFGKRQPWNPIADEMTLVEWFADQFDEEDMILIRSALPNVF